MLWFKFIFGSKFFKPVWFLFPFVLDYDNKYEKMDTKYQTGLKNFKPKINLKKSFSQLIITITKFEANMFYFLVKRGQQLSLYSRSMEKEPILVQLFNMFNDLQQPTKAWYSAEYIRCSNRAIGFLEFCYS